MGLGSLVVFERQQRLVTVQAWVLQLDVEACSVFFAHLCILFFSFFKRCLHVPWPYCPFDVLCSSQGLMNVELAPLFSLIPLFVKPIKDRLMSKLYIYFP